MVKDNILKVKKRIGAASVRAAAAARAVTIVAVTKNRSAEEIKEAIASGITDIGENRIQEAEVKFADFCALGPKIRELNPDLRALKWHFIGRLQTNKVKEAVKIFDLIQSVDSLRLAQEIDKQAEKINKIQDILVEIKTSPEENKSGIKPDAAAGIIKEIAQLKNISIKGLMTIAPLAVDAEQARPYFRQLRELRDNINAIRILSMGMTDDFEIAVEEGSTMVRLGRAIFE